MVLPMESTKNLGLLGPLLNGPPACAGDRKHATKTSAEKRLSAKRVAEKTWNGCPPNRKILGIGFGSFA
jgi:hypothetical protein